MGDMRWWTPPPKNRQGCIKLGLLCEALWAKKAGRKFLPFCHRPFNLCGRDHRSK